MSHQIEDNFGVPKHGKPSGGIESGAREAVPPEDMGDSSEPRAGQEHGPAAKAPYAPPPEDMPSSGTAEPPAKTERVVPPEDTVDPDTVVRLPPETRLVEESPGKPLARPRFRLGPVLWAIVLLVVVVLANEIAQFVASGFQTHAVLGWVNLGAVCLLGLLLLVQVRRDVRAWRRLSNVDRLREAYDQLLKNPRDGSLQNRVKELVDRYLRVLEQESDSDVELRERIENLHRRMEVADDPVGWRDDITRILLKPWDEEVQTAISREALQVALATAISPYAFLDASIALWRNVRLIRCVAEVYHVRPGVVGTLRLLYRVAAAVAVADLGQHGSEMLAQAGGSILRGMPLLGRVAQGLTNAAMTFHVGRVAQEACRPLRVADDERKRLWTELKQTIADALKEGLSRAKEGPSHPI